MPIKLVHEDDCDVAMIVDFEASSVLEECHFCSKQTRFWSAKSNTPVCPSCAKVRHWTELPRRLQWVDPAYVPKRKLTRAQINLREMLDDLELDEQALILAGTAGRELDYVRQQLRVGHLQLIREGLPVKRPVVLPGEAGNEFLAPAQLFMQRMQNA